MEIVEETPEELPEVIEKPEEIEPESIELEEPEIIEPIVPDNSTVANETQPLIEE